MRLGKFPIRKKYAGAGGVEPASLKNRRQAQLSLFPGMAERVTVARGPQTADALKLAKRLLDEGYIEIGQARRPRPPGRTYIYKPEYEKVRPFIEVKAALEALMEIKQANVGKLVERLPYIKGAADKAFKEAAHAGNERAAEKIVMSAQTDVFSEILLPNNKEDSIVVGWRSLPKEHSELVGPALEQVIYWVFYRAYLEHRGTVRRAAPAANRTGTHP